MSVGNCVSLAGLLAVSWGRDKDEALECGLWSLRLAGSEFGHAAWRKFLQHCESLELANSARPGLCAGMHERPFAPAAKIARMSGSLHEMVVRRWPDPGLERSWWDSELRLCGCAFPAMNVKAPRAQILQSRLPSTTAIVISTLARTVHTSRPSPASQLP